jgi:hypothetical protein
LQSLCQLAGVLFPSSPKTLAMLCALEASAAASLPTPFANQYRALVVALAVARSLPHPKKTVISTEVAHSLIVSSAAEKSASLPTPSANQYRALVVACGLSAKA